MSSPCMCASTAAGVATTSGGGTGSPDTTHWHDWSRSSNPRPPASTTPASRSTGSSSGVRSTAVRAAAAACSSRPSSVVSPSARARSTDSAAMRTTVRMVPSTGRSTASYAASAARRRPATTSGACTTSSGANVSARPRRIWLRITPEFPRAPMSDPCEIAVHTARIPVAESASAPSSSPTTDSSVSAMLVPVSPSGTG